ncbi:ribosome maturation factor RimP [Gimibacter soli]|uniref:Ribosome maturation factor RimP n=1 Tax=Gimibacter soli TaxID=3024400 RepID=A0AAE9XNF9_9PROT|nr:ribosome maturation factor RimP [Gimibacter soli]WCL54237.1 ribosome maturation factor RimP [Gimibacter soli]
MNEPADKITALIAPTVEALGFELVRVTYGGGRKPTLQIMAERPDGSMGVDDCAIISREVSALLDVEDPLPGEYLLEVSSPGIDRPLTRRKDFERWMGFDAKVELMEQIDGRRRFRGKLVSLAGDTLTLDTEDEGKVELDYGQIGKAKLVLTDELLKAVQKKAADAAAAAEAAEGDD